MDEIIIKEADPAPAPAAAPVVITPPAAGPDYTQQFIDLNDKLNELSIRVDRNENSMYESLSQLRQDMTVTQETAAEEITPAPVVETPAIEETTEITPPEDKPNDQEDKKHKHNFLSLLGFGVGEDDD